MRDYLRDKSFIKTLGIKLYYVNLKTRKKFWPRWLGKLLLLPLGGEAFLRVFKRADYKHQQFMNLGSL